MTGVTSITNLVVQKHVWHTCDGLHIFPTENMKRLALSWKGVDSNLKRYPFSPMTVYPEPGSDICFGFIQWIFALSHSLICVMLFLPWMSSLSQGLIHFMLFLLLLSQGVIYALHILTFLPLCINRLVRPGWMQKEIPSQTKAEWSTPWVALQPMKRVI